MTPVRVPAVVGAVVLTDMLTKQLVPTHPGFLHARSTGYAVSGILIGGLLVLAGILLPRLAVGLLLVGAATVANGVDALDGLVRNPWLVPVGGGQGLAFNTADVTMVAGAVVLVVTVVRTVGAGRLREQRGASLSGALALLTLLGFAAIAVVTLVQSTR